MGNRLHSFFGELFGGFPAGYTPNPIGPYYAMQQVVYKGERCTVIGVADDGLLTLKKPDRRLVTVSSADPELCIA